MKSASLSSRPYCDAAILAGLSLTMSAHAVDIIKANNTTNLNVGTSWSGGTAPGAADVGVWNNTVTAANTTVLGGDLSLSGLKIINPGGVVTINTGNTLTLGSAGIDMSAATQNLTLNNAITLDAGQTWNVASGRTLTAAGTVGGTGIGLIKAGTGNLTLTGVKSYSGGTTINDGTLKVDMTASTGSQTLGTVAINGGVYELFNTNTTVDGTLTTNSVFSGAGSLRKTGGGYLNLTFTGSNINTFNGTLDVQAGTLGFNQGVQGSGNATLQIASGALVDVRTGTLKVDAFNGVAGSTVYVSHTAGGTLSIGNNGGSGTFAGTLAAGGSGLSIIKNGNGTQSFSGAGNHTGTTTVNTGTLKLINPSAWTSPIALATTNSPNLELSAPLAADTWNLNRQISGANSAATVTKTGAGTVILTANQTYTGATQVNEGKLILSNALPTGFPTISGMKVWLDAADPEGDGDTTIPTNGSGVSTWKNKGTLGATADFTASTSGTNPPTYTASVAAFNNKPTITFTAATGKMLANTVNYTNTVSVVYVGRIGTTKQRLVSGGTTNWILGYHGGNMGANYWNGGVLGSTADTNPHIWINGATSGTNMLGYRFDAAGETPLGNGTGGVGPVTGLTLGGGWNVTTTPTEKSDGDIAELFVFDHQLTTTERQQLEGYLYNKYFGGQFGIIALNSASPVTVANGATFGGYGSAGNIAVNGGTLEGGNAISGTLTAGAVTTSGVSTFKGLLSAAAGSKAFSVSDLAINGGDQSLLINATGTGLTDGGTYDLLVSTNPITAPGATSVQAALKSTSRLYTPVIDGTGTKIQVTYDADASVYWTGAAGTAWNTAATSWKLSGNDSETQFQVNDVVLFHDSPASSVVDISGADVNPAATTFDNASTAYTLQGSNGISTGTITKTNAGSLAITNVNTTTGAVALNGGVVSLSQSGGLGTGPISFGGGSLNYGGSSTTWTRDFTLGGAGEIGVTNAASTLTHAGTIAGSGALTKSGAGTLVLATNNPSYAGGAHLGEGTLQLNAASSLTVANDVYFDNNASNPTLVFNNGGNVVASLSVGTNVSNAVIHTRQWAPAINGTTTLNSALTQKGTSAAGWNGMVYRNKITGNGAGAGNDTLILDANGQTATANAFVWQYDGTIANDFAGNVLVKGGTTNAQALNGANDKDNIMFPDAAMLTIATGSTFRWNNTNVGGARAVFETIDGLAGGGLYDRAGAAATSTLTINANNVENDGDRVFTGNLAGLASLTLGGTGMQEFSGSVPNFIFGTNLNNGTLRLTKTTAWGSNIVLGGSNTPTLQLNAELAGDSWSFGKAISGGSASATVAKTGTGTVTLSGPNTYLAGTSVDNGTLLVTNTTGSGTGGGEVTVNATGTFGGTGSVTGTVTAAGTLAPGTTGTGTLTTGAVTLTGTYACQIDGATSDMLAINGSLSLTGATLAISTISAPTAPSYVIATYTGAVPAFTTVTGLPAGYVVDTSTPGQIKLASAYASWASSKGLTEANGGKNQNPDGDGLDNLMEYAFGTDPLVSSGASIAWSGATVTSPGSPTTSITNNGNSVDYRAVFGRRQDYLAAGLIYTVQFSADLSQWVNSSATPTVVATGTEIDAVSVPYPFFIPTTNGMEKPTFFRVAVTENQ